jgi:hypothetical protein
MFSGRMIFRAESPAICAVGAGIAKKARASPVQFSWVAPLDLTIEPNADVGMF